MVVSNTCTQAYSGTVDAQADAEVTRDSVNVFDLREESSRADELDSEASTLKPASHPSPSDDSTAYSSAC